MDSQKPNILFKCADDACWWNVGANNHKDDSPYPNIDRLAIEGMLFTDHYALPACTRGRATFTIEDSWSADTT